MMKLKNIILWAGAAILAVACSDELGSRVDQYANVGIPVPITVKSVRNIAGGAVIKVTIPDDPNLKGVVAEYERRGEIVNAKISRYVDSLTVEGYADTKKHKVTLYSFNVNEERSSGVDVEIEPLTPAIMGVNPVIYESFGGVKVHIQNNTSKSDLAICILRDEDLSDLGKPLSQMKWVEVTTLFTASEDIYLSRRGIEPKEAIFGMYLRDHWGNISDTTVVVLTPILEVRLADYKVDGKNYYKFSNANIPDDNCESTSPSQYPVSALWDGSGLSEIPHFFVSPEGGPSPTWLTIDLGNMARLSRITTLPRIGYVIYGGGAVRDYEFWGSPGELQPDGSYIKPTGKTVTPTESNPYGFDPDVWFCLGKFTQAKPSGYLPNGLPGDITPEDSQVYNAGNDFELDPVQYPHCNDPIRYLRVIFVNTFSTFEYGHETKNRQVQTGEVTPFGQPITE
ncbi:MAG: DUF4959 domain-containing protein [Bacteroidales bacterium]|nr:DUF4959 domain-containing protein [Bacteroidales bacterium]